MYHESVHVPHSLDGHHGAEGYQATAQALHPGRRHLVQTQSHHTSSGVAQRSDNAFLSVRCCMLCVHW